MTSRERRGPRRSAIVWIDERHAVVASTSENDKVATAEIDRGSNPEARYLADIVHQVLDRERVMIVGSGPARLALEREFVAISHRPDRLIATPLFAASTSDKIADRLRQLAA